MPRQLVVCLDGTGNRFSVHATNIVRLFRCLDHGADVLAFYDQGVGTFGTRETLFDWQNVPARMLGLAFGWGIRRNVENAYRFLAEHLRDGDEIFLFGFSRGAFAVRALAAMIRAVGLLPPHQLHLFEYAWTLLRARDRGKPDFALQARFKHVFARPTRIRFMGLFDTVKSVGWIYDPVVIPHTANNPIVEIVRHAVSIDERRCFFRQHLWHPEPSERTDVREVWFAGVHSDVGGGYPDAESHLSRVTLRWMLAEAHRFGLRLRGEATHRQLRPRRAVGPDATGIAHEELRGAWRLAEWIPRNVLTGRPDGERAWEIGRTRARFIRPGILLHRSVVDRMAAMPGYRPGNLPADHHVVDDHPDLLTLLPDNEARRRG
ncbi:MAG: DUF2235 domain-containing protein [Burkholderiales bacterium]|nr:DUF2235 domain-containing protein [Burkholderiales bacterium]